MFSLERISWVTSGLIGVVLATLFTLCIKDLSIVVPHAVLYFYIFIICWIVVLIWSPGSLKAPPTSKFWLIIGAGIFSFLGNTAEVAAIVRAPQVGYVTAIKMSQVVFVTIAAVLFLKKKELNLTSSLGICAVVGGCVLIALTSNSSVHSDNVDWALLSLCSAIFFSVMVIATTKLNESVGLSTILLLFLPVACIGFLVTAKVQNQSFIVPLPQAWKILVGGIFGGLSNIFAFDAIFRAPHPGYGSALNAFQIVLVTLVASLVFHNQQVTTIGWIGVLLCVAGIAVIANYSDRRAA